MKTTLALLILSTCLSLAYDFVMINIPITNNVSLSTNILGPWEQQIWQTNVSINYMGYDQSPNGMGFVKGTNAILTKTIISITNTP